MTDRKDRYVWTDGDITITPPPVPPTPPVPPPATPPVPGS